MATAETKAKSLKGKLIHSYELLVTEKEPWLTRPGFWHEFFLLKANIPALEHIVECTPREKLIELQVNLNQLFCQCCQCLNEEDNHLKLCNALKALSGVLRSLYKKDFPNRGFDVIEVLIGFKDAESQIMFIIDRTNNILSSNLPAPTKKLVVKLFSIIFTLDTNVSENVLLEYFMNSNVFELLIRLVEDPDLREDLGYEAVIILALLVNYRKYEGSNPFLAKLSILDKEIALNGLGNIIGEVIADRVRQFILQKQSQSQGLLGSITSAVGFWRSENETLETDFVSASDLGIVLGLYEIVHQNRNFVNILSAIGVYLKVSSSLNPEHTKTSDHTLAVQGVGSGTDSEQACNLLVNFLSFTSVALQNIKSEIGSTLAKLCLIILTLVTEDQYACAFIHDPSMVFVVPIHRSNLHRWTPNDKLSPRPLACAIQELMISFLESHMTKNLPLELYCTCVGILHRCLCYQKRYCVRLPLSWNRLWTVLINLLKFIVSTSETLTATLDTYKLAIQVVNIFNLFVTYGDTFLPSPDSYDDLYYETMRMSPVFDNLYQISTEHVESEHRWKDSAQKLINTLSNIRTIISHFRPKIETWSAAHKMVSLSTEQVLGIIKSNYDSLTLKLIENLDFYEKYAEKPKEYTFFQNLVRLVASDVRANFPLVPPCSP